MPTGDHRCTRAGASTRPRNQRIPAGLRGVSAAATHGEPPPDRHRRCTSANQRAEVSDVFEKVSGTSGLIGVVDSLLLLQRRRGDDVGMLSVSGREVEDQEIALSFTDGWWGPASEGMPAALLDEKREVREL